MELITEKGENRIPLKACRAVFLMDETFENGNRYEAVGKRRGGSRSYWSVEAWEPRKPSPMFALLKVIFPSRKCARGLSEYFEGKKRRLDDTRGENDCQYDRRFFAWRYSSEMRSSTFPILSVEIFYTYRVSTLLWLE